MKYNVLIFMRKENKIMNKRNLLLLLFVLAIAFITFFGYVSGHYSTDDYNIMNIGYNYYSIVNNLREGRPVMYLIDQFALKINMSYELFIKLTVILAIFITSVTVIIFFNIVKKYFEDNKLEKEIFILLISYTIFFNFMYIENLYFLESLVMALTLLSYVISANYLVKRRHIILSIVLAIAGNFCYNGFQCAYITLVCILSLLQNKDSYKKVIRDILVAGLIIILSVICNLIQIKWTCSVYNMINTRMGNLSLTNIICNIVYIIYRIPIVLLYTVELFPKYYYVIIIMSILIFALIYAKKNNNKKILLDILLISFVSIFSCFCIFLISLSSFWTGRLLYGIGMTIGLLFLVVIQHTEKFWRKFFEIAFVIYFIINIVNAVYIIDLHKEVNDIEKAEILDLEEYINNYEQENRYIVNKITYIADESFDNLYYSNINRRTVITHRSLACMWAYAGAINFYTERNLEQIQCTEEIIEFYDNADTEINNGIICYKDILICPVSCW